MGTQLWTWTIWLFILIGAITQTHVAGSGTCKQECPSTTSSVFHYQDGQKYTYNLEGTTITTLPSAQGDVSKLQLKATVELSIQSACSHIIKLKGVQVIGPDAKKYGSLKELETHPVIANFQGGVMNTQLCTEDADSPAALNIKRAVISLLQSSISAGSSGSNIREVDVFGSCPTEISTSKQGDLTTVRKTRNLNRCSHREDLKQDVLSTPFVGNADLHSTPLLDATYTAEQQIKKGVVNSVTVQESYLFRPFAKQGSGARTTIETKLTLVSDKGQATPAPASVNTPRSIIFEAHPTGPTGNTNNKQVIVAALQNAIESMKVEVGPTSARKFSALVSILRHSSKDDILSVYGQVKTGAGFSNKQSARKVLLDALFRTGTGDSIIVAVELLKSNEISGQYAKLWYTGFGFVRHATLSSLTAASTLLDQPNLPHEALLGIGSLAGRYCRQHSCENVPQFNDLISKISRTLKTSVASKEEENTVIAALKALHNIHHLNDAVTETLYQIASERSLPARVRVAALETFQSDACHVKLKKAALEILNNNQEDSEIRIKAYLALVECPSGSVANSLKELLENEPTNQVGSYIVSHLRNIRASTNPSKAEVKRHLGLLKPRKHFPEDFRKFSHNYELSYILDGLNIGTSVESNVIFSQSSFLPRSISHNLTVDIFGHSYNVFEVSARAENADRILESYIGPKGYLKTHSWHEIFETIREVFTRSGNQIKEKFQQILRNKRSVNQNDLERIKNEVIKSLPSQRGNELILDLSLKIFGSELAWLSVDQNTHELSPEGIINKVFDTLNGAIDKAKHFNHDVKQHCTFLDTELTYPTGLGLPLKLIASGSSAIHLKLDGQIDIPALLRNPGSSVVQLDVIPSAAVEITGELLVDAYAVESGLKVAYVLHTATGANVAIKGLSGDGVDINVGLPLKKQDILTVKTEVLSTVQERGHSEVDTPVTFSIQRKEYEFCFDQLSQFTGLTLCGEARFPYESLNSPSAFFPLNGPSILSLSIESEDVSSYHFKALKNDKDANHQTIELLFETPNSKTSRKLALLMERNTEPNKEIKISLDSPWKKIVAQGILIDTNKEQSITAKFLNDADEYSIKAGARLSGDSSHQTYTPLLEYKSPDQKEPSKGTKSFKNTQSYSVRGTVTVDRQENSRKYTFNKVSLNTPQGHYEVDGTVSKEDNSFSSQLTMTYGQQNIILNSKLEKIGDKHYKIKAEVIPSQQTDLGISITLNHERKSNEWKNDLVLIHGSDLSSEDARITIGQLLHFRYDSPTDFNIFTKNSLTYPILNINLKFHGSATPKTVDYELIAGYDNYRIASHLQAKTAVKKVGDYDIAFMAQILNSTLNIKSIREIKTADTSRFINVLELIPVVKYELTSDVTHIYKPNNINQQINSVLKIDGEPKEYKLDLGLILNPQLIDTQAKLIVGSDKIVDNKLVIHKDGAGPNGNAKVYVKNYIEAISTFNYNKAGGQAALSIDFPKINRKIRGNTDLTIAGTVHTGKIELYWNADEDPSQKLTIQTVSDIKTDSIDSKNTIIILDHKTIFNVKGALTGEMYDGHLIANGDLTLPNGRQIIVKYDRTLHIRQTNSEGRVEIVLTDIVKGSQPRKLSLEAAAKDVDINQLSFEGSGKLEYKSSEGKDLKVTVNAKNIFQGQQKTIGGEVLLEGSLIPKPLKLKLNAEVSKAVITYKAGGGYGSDSSLNVAGTVRTGLGGTSARQIDNTVELKVPTEPLKQLKLTTSITLTNQPDSPCELKTNNVLVWNNANTLKLDGELSGDKVHGSGKVVITLPKEQARSLAVTWSNPEDIGSGLKRAGSLTLQWNGNKEVKVIGEIQIPQDKQSYRLKLTGATPVESLRTLDLTLSSKRSETPAKHIETDAVLILNDKTITVTSKIGLALGVPIIDFTAVLPQGTTKLYVDVEKLNEEHVKLRANAQWFAYGGGTLTSDGELKLSMDDFKLVLNIDSPKLKFDKWHAEAGHKAVKGTKRVVFVVKSAGSNILSGSTSLRHKVDGNSVTYDGNGNVEIGSQQPQRFNFHLERVQLVQDTNGEVGIEYKGNVQVGPKKMEGLIKSSTKEVNFLQKYCPSADRCANVEASSKLIVLDVSEINHEANLIIDLVALEIPQGMNLKAKTIRHDWNIDQEVDLQIKSKEHETKYNSKVQISEKKTLATITLPQRVIALEITANVDSEEQSERRKVGFTLWWDKVHKPSLRSTGSVILTHNTDENGLHLSGEAKFNNPLLERELVISGQSLIGGQHKFVDSSLDIDVFKNKNQKINVLLKISRESIEQGYNISHIIEIKSKGQNLDIVLLNSAAASLTSVAHYSHLSYKTSKQPKKEVILKFISTLDNLNILVRFPNSDIIHVDGTLTWANDLPVVDGVIQVLGLQPIVLHSAVQKKGLLSFSSYIHKKNTPNHKLQISGGIDGGVGVNAQIINGGEKKDLIHILISTKDDDFLKTDFGWSTENIQKLLAVIHQDLSSFLQQVKQFITDYVKQLKDEIIALLETLRKNQPSIKRLLEVSQQQLNAIKTEITNDAVLRDISNNLHEITGDILTNIGEVTKGISNTLDACLKAFGDFQNAVIDSLKNASPAISEAWTNIVNSVVGIFEFALQELSNLIVELTNIIKSHEVELKRVIGSITELFRDVTQTGSKALHKVVQELSDFAKIIIDEVKTLHIFSLTKDRYAEIIQELSAFELPVNVWTTIKELVSAVKDGLPTQELQDLVSAIESYIEKRVQNTPVDHRAELQSIYQKFLRAVRSLITVVRAHIAEPSDSSTGLLGLKIPVSLNNLLQLPRIIAIRLSPITYLISEDLPSLTDLYYTYRPTLNPLDWIPPFRSYGILVDSNHFFTFDHRHYTFKGSCSYVLAQDYLDGNFSLVVTLEAGQLKSITISDNSNSIELLADMSLKVNGAASEYPVEQGDFVAWRQYNSANIKTKAGVYIHCHTDVNLCIFHVSGFYFGRTRGLLGTIDNEQWDDFSRPNGQIASKANEFANSWKLNAQCADVPEESVDSTSPVPECTEIFSGNTVLRACYPFVNPTPFREACNEVVRNLATPTEKKQKACSIAASYVEICKTQTLLINIPSSCVQCSATGGNKIGTTETFTQKVPQRSADVVIVVEQMVDNAEIYIDLITPLVSSLTNDLKSKSISDVNYSVIGYGAPGQTSPSHYTSNGELGFGNKNVKFLDHEPTDNTTHSTSQWLKQKLDSTVRRVRMVEAFNEATQYPFRVDAVHTIIGVVGTPCEETNILTPLPLLLAQFYREQGISIHLITPVESIHATGKEDKQIKQIVGFDSDAVYTQGDAKKKPLDGDAEFRKVLDYKSSVCIEGAQKTHGAVFNTNNFVNAKQAARKQFLQVVSHRIADSLTSTELTKQCVCLIHDNTHAKPLCRVTNRREKEQTKSAVKTTKG